MGIVRNQSIKNSISFYIGMAIGAINTVVIYPNVFNDYPEHLGLIQIIIAYAIVISTFSSLGIPKTFIKFFPSIKQKGQLYFFSLLVPFFGFLFSSFIYILFKDDIFRVLNASDLLQDNFFYILLLVFFICFYDLLTAISRSFLNAATPVFINEVFLKIYSMSMLLLHWFDIVDFTTFLQIYLFGYFLKFAILFFLQWKAKRLEINFSFDDLDLKELLRFGFYVLIGGASIIIVTRLDMMMIASLLDLEQVAFYTIAFFIGNAIKIPARSVSAISNPLLAKAWEQQDMKEIKTLYIKSSINQLIIGGIFFLCVWINVDNIFALLPDKFQEGKWVVFYIGLSQLINISCGLNGAIIINSKYYKYDLYTNMLLVFITIATNYIFIPVFGINGAAMATAISLLLFNILRLFLIKIKMDIQPFNLSTVKTVLLLSLVFVIINILPAVSHPFFDIVFKSLMAITVFIPLVLYFNLSDDISGMIKDIRKRLLS